MPSKTKQSTPGQEGREQPRSPPGRLARQPPRATQPRQPVRLRARQPRTASAGKGASGKKVNPALMKPLQPSKELAAVVGSKPLPRPEVVSKVWDYIKRNNLQNPQNKRGGRKADDKLEKVFGRRSFVTMFEMNKHLAQHLK